MYLSNWAPRKIPWVINSPPAMNMFNKINSNYCGDL